MPIWGQLSLQEGITTVIELLNYFHDYIIAILLLIMTFVTYLFFVIIFSSKVDKNTIDSHFLETV
jgi:hypothetical protein